MYRENRRVGNANDPAGGSSRAAGRRSVPFRALYPYIQRDDDLVGELRSKSLPTLVPSKSAGTAVKAIGSDTGGVYQL